MSKPEDKPPAYPSQAQDAGPYPSPSPYNQYGGFSNPSQQALPPSQAHLDPRAGGNFASPAPGNFASPAPGGYASPAPYGPPGGYYGQPQGQQMVYGPGPGPGQGPGMYGPPQQQGYYPNGTQGYYGGPGGYQGGYYPQGGYYERDRGMGAGEGFCAALFASLACCCCLDFLVF